MEKNIYLISYIILKENELPSVGNMCSEMVIKNTSILNEMIKEIQDRTDTNGKVWITNIIKLN